MMPCEVEQQRGRRYPLGSQLRLRERPFCRLAGFQRFIGGLLRWPGSRGTSGPSTWGAGLGGSRSQRDLAGGSGGGLLRD